MDNRGSDNHTASSANPANVSSTSRISGPKLIQKKLLYNNYLKSLKDIERGFDTDINIEAATKLFETRKSEWNYLVLKLSELIIDIGHQNIEQGEIQNGFRTK